MQRLASALSQILLISAVCVVCVGNVHAAGQSMLIIDASGSMWGKIDGKTKIAIARETLSTVLKSVPPDRELGLMAYGHRRKGQCNDIEQLVAPAKGQRNRNAIANAVKKLNPKGKTPLADSVRQAAHKLKYTEDEATVILITDGLETCAPDPCKVASELEAAGLDFVVHVVGFGLSEEQGKQVACLAENTGGKFFPANKAGDLTAALTETVVKAPVAKPKALVKNVTVTVALAEGAPEYDIKGRLDFFELQDDKPVKKTSGGGWGTTITTTLAPARYLMRYTKNLVVRESTVEVKQDTPFRQTLLLDAGVLKLGIAGGPNKPAHKKARVDVTHQGKKVGSWGQGAFVVPAGEHRIEGKLGKATVQETITIGPGEIIEKTLIAAVGHLAVTAVYTEGGEAANKGVRHDVLPAKASIDGKRKPLAGSWGNGKFLLPPGDYLIRSKMNQAQVSTPVTVEGDQRREIVVNLNAGVLAVSADGARRIDIKSASKNTQGKRRAMGGKWGHQYQGVLPPGDYIAIARYKDKKETVEKLVTVKAGERTEASLP